VFIKFVTTEQSSIRLSGAWDGQFWFNCQRYVFLYVCIYVCVYVCICTCVWM